MKKILIFTTNGGGGHTSVTNALKQYFHGLYDIKEVDTFCDVLKNIDIIRTISFGKTNFAHTYNFLISRKWTRFTNLGYRVGLPYLKVTRDAIIPLINKTLEYYDPDLIISVTPLITKQLITMAQAHQIPTIIIPTDLDSQTFMFNVNKPRGDQFRVAVSFDEPDITKMILDAGIDRSALVTTGFAIRKDFYENKDTNALKKEFNIPQNTPVIMIMMGAVGSCASCAFVKELRKVKHPVHLLVCVGKDRKAYQELSNMTLPKNISMTIQEFTTRISDLMAVSDMILTKSGTVSVCEALYMNVPMLLDATSQVLLWEQFNHRFIETHGFGQSITSMERLSEVVDELLSNPEYLQNMSTRMKHYQKNHAPTQLLELVESLLKDQQKWPPHPVH